MVLLTFELLMVYNEIVFFNLQEFFFLRSVLGCCVIAVYFIKVTGVNRGVIDLVSCYDCRLAVEYYRYQKKY